MHPQLLITHDGQFHADEVFALALILYVYGPTPIERRRQVETKELLNPVIWVLDQYGQYEPSLGNFDHHQDKNLQSTNMLVLAYFKAEGLVSKELYDLLRAPFKTISAIDREGYNDFNGFQVNEFFKSLNNLPNGFETALSMAQTWLASMIRFSENKDESKKIWASGEVLASNVRLCQAFPMFWKSYEQERILIYPDKGMWKVISADPETLPIQETGAELFIHTNKFIAGYHRKEYAIDAALISARVPITII